MSDSEDEYGPICATWGSQTPITDNTTDKWKALADPNTQVGPNELGSGNLHRRGHNFKPVDEDLIIAQRNKVQVSKKKKKEPSKEPIKKPGQKKKSTSTTTTTINKDTTLTTIKLPQQQSVWTSSSLVETPFWEPQHNKDTTVPTQWTTEATVENGWGNITKQTPGWEEFDKQQDTKKTMSQEPLQTNNQVANDAWSNVDKTPRKEVKDAWSNVNKAQRRDVNDTWSQVNQSQRNEGNDVWSQVDKSRKKDVSDAWSQVDKSRKKDVSDAWSQVDKSRKKDVSDAWSQVDKSQKKDVSDAWSQVDKSQKKDVNDAWSQVDKSQKSNGWGNVGSSPKNEEALGGRGSDNSENGNWSTWSSDQVEEKPVHTPVSKPSDRPSWLQSVNKSPSSTRFSIASRQKYSEAHTIDVPEPVNYKRNGKPTIPTATAPPPPPENRHLITINVELSSNHKISVMIRELDDPFTLATTFAKTHNISSDKVVEALTKLFATQKEQALKLKNRKLQRRVPKPNNSPVHNNLFDYSAYESSPAYQRPALTNSPRPFSRNTF